MTARTFTQAELEAYLDEALTPAEMAEVEAQLRDQPDLLRRLQAIHGRRDAGMHSLGQIWRRYRLSCADRETLGSYLLGVLPDEEASYVRFHIEQIGCRLCAANLDDLRERQRKLQEAGPRRLRIFESSAGYLRRK
jgi:anti-sigma factor RsiW